MIHSMNSNAPHFWQEKIDQFLNYLRFERSASMHTLSTYKRILNSAGAHFFDRLNMQDWEECSSSIVRNWMVHLRSQSLSSSSLNLYLSAIRTFLRWIYRFKPSELKPISCQVHSRKQRLPKIISPEQAHHLISINEQDALSIRDRAILELFYSSGLRLQELTSLKKNAFSADRSLLKIHGKGNKERWVPVGTRAQARVKEWLNLCEEKKISSPYLFTSLKSKPLSVRAIQKRVSYWGLKRLNVHLHPHILRHTFATHFLSATQDIRAVQEVLGHQKLVTTQRYTHLDFQKITEVYDRTHPRQKDRFKNNDLAH